MMFAVRADSEGDEVGAIQSRVRADADRQGVAGRAREYAAADVARDGAVNRVQAAHRIAVEERLAGGREPAGRELAGQREIGRERVVEVTKRIRRNGNRRKVILELLHLLRRQLRVVAEQAL